MGPPGLLVRRVAGAPGVVVAAAVIALFATTVLTALVGHSDNVTREGARRTLERTTFAQAGTRISAPVPPGGFAAAQQRVDTALRRVYREVPLTVSAGARSGSFTLPGQEKREHPELAVFATYSGIERHAKLLAGRWPAPGGEVEAVLPAPAAQAMRLEPGAVLTMRGRVDTGRTVRARVVGIFSPGAPDDYFWQGDRLVGAGVERLDYTTYGPLVVRPEVFGETFMATGAEVRWTVRPDLGGLDAAAATALGRRVRESEKALAAVDPGTQYAVATELPVLTAQLRGAVLVARSTMLMPVLQLVLLAGYALVLVARLLADHRRVEVALLRTRGASLRQLCALTLAEGLVIVLPAAVLGPLLAGPLLAAVGEVPAVRAAGLRLTPGPLAPLWGVAVAAALACALVLAVPTLRGAGRTFVETQAGIGRARRGALRGTGADLALLAVAALGLWQLTRYGGVPATGADEDGPAGGVDPFIVSGPALALLAGGTLLLRLVPLTSRAAERATARGRGLAAALGARQVSRRPLRYAGPALLLVMAMAVGVLSVTTMTTWRASQRDQADFRSGSDLRVTAPDGARAPRPAGQAARYAALPGVTGAAGVARKNVLLGNRTATLLVVDSARLAPVLRVRPDLERGLNLPALTAARPREAVAPIPGRPARLRFTMRLAPDGPRPEGRFAAWATLVDAAGLHHRVDLPGLVPDGRDQRIEVRLADLAGPGGRLSYPLALRGLHYDQYVNPRAGAQRLSLVALADADSGARVPPVPGPREAFLEVRGQTDTLDRDRRTDPGVLLTMGVPATPPPERYGAPMTGIAHVLFASGRPPVRVAKSQGRPRLPVVRGVVTESLARATGVRTGGTVTLSTADGDQPVTVAAVVPALPTDGAGRPGVLVDLRTLAERHAVSGLVTPDATRPTEWWLALRDGRAGPALKELSAHPDWGEPAGDRLALRSELLDAPLGAALQSALVLGFAAALAFAVVAFVVNAVVSARERAREFTVLRALGVPPRQVAGMLAVEQAFLVGLGLAGGLALGLLVARLVVPKIVLTVQAAAPYPPADLVVRWPLVLGVTAGVALVLALVVAVLLRVLHRRGLGADLRAGEDR